MRTGTARETGMDIVTETVGTGTGTGIVNGTAVDVTEANVPKEETATARGNGIEEIVTVSAKDMDVEERKSHPVAPGMRTTVGANSMMTAAAGAAEGVERTRMIVVEGVVDVAKETQDHHLVAPHLSVALLLHRTQCPYRSVRGKPVDGMSMPQAMSSTLPCRPSRLVCPDILPL